MKYYFRFGLLVLFISVSTLLFSQEKPFKNFPLEEKIKLPHQKPEEEKNQNQKRVITKEYSPGGFEITEYLNQTWNGTAFENSNKTTITFNILGLQDEYLYQLWDGTNWQNEYVSHYMYNSNNKIDQIISQEWNGSAWQNSYRDIYNYNSNNLQTEYIGQNWNTSMWVNNFRYTYTYNANEDITETITYTWDGVVWINSYQYLYTYDSNSNITSVLIKSWDGAAWVNNNMYSYTYTTNNKIDNYITQSWNGTNWVNNYKYTYTYDSNDNNILFTAEFWDGSAWVGNYRFSYTYDSNDNLTISVYQQWNGTNLTWDNYSRNVNTYNSGNLQLTSRYQIWVFNNWEDDYLYSYTYDNTDLHLLLEFVGQSWNGTAWVNEFRTLYTWTKVTGVDEVDPLEDFILYNNYPNPFNPSTAIKYSLPQSSFLKLIIYNTLGEEIKEIFNGIKDAGVYEEYFTADGISSGVYFCRIEAQTSDGKQNFISTIKMILLK